MLINTDHILTVSEPLETYINKKNAVEIKYPNIIIFYGDGEHTPIFFKDINRAGILYNDILRNKNKFIEVDMTFTESIYNGDIR